MKCEFHERGFSAFNCSHESICLYYDEQVCEVFSVCEKHNSIVGNSPSFEYTRRFLKILSEEEYMIYKVIYE